MKWLADPLREGRGVRHCREARSRWGVPRKALPRARAFAGGGDADGYGQLFSVTTGVKVNDETSLQVGKLALAPERRRPGGVFDQRQVRGDLVLAGYGISLKELGGRRLREARGQKGYRGGVLFRPRGGQMERLADAQPRDRRHSLQGVDGA